MSSNHWIVSIVMSAVIITTLILFLTEIGEMSTTKSDQIIITDDIDNDDENVLRTIVDQDASSVNVIDVQTDIHDLMNEGKDDLGQYPHTIDISPSNSFCMERTDNDHTGPVPSDMVSTPVDTGEHLVPPPNVGLYRN